MNRTSKAIELFDEHKYEEALSMIEEAESNNEITVEMYLYRGRILQKLSKYGPAINAYNKAIELDPNDPRAANEIELIRNILSITNNFYYENPYTDTELIDKL